MAENAPEQQDRGLFGLFGKKDEHQQEAHGNAEHHGNMPVPVAPAYQHESGVTLEPVHSAEYGHVVDPPKHGHGHGHEGGGGIMSKLHRSDSSSSSSSDEEGEDGKKKKKGLKDKIKGGHKTEEQQYKNEQQQYHAGEGVKKEGLVDKIKDKLPGHKKEGEY